MLRTGTPEHCSPVARPQAREDARLAIAAHAAQPASSLEDCLRPASADAEWAAAGGLAAGAAGAYLRLGEALMAEADHPHRDAAGAAEVRSPAVRYAAKGRAAGKRGAWQCGPRC
jgi:hypothetical protein